MGKPGHNRTGFARLALAHSVWFAGFVLVLAFIPTGGADLSAAELSARDVTIEIYRSEPGTPANFEQVDLRDLDLSGVDFKDAQLRGADLFGVDLTRSNLSRVDLRNARLDRVTILGARFDHADLEGASLLRPAVFSTLENVREEAVSFVGANLRGATVFGRFSGCDFSGADFSGANLAPVDGSSFIEHVWRSEFLGAKLRSAKFQNANVERVWFAFADLRGADFSGASLKHADFSGADLRGANFAGADVSHADFSEAKLDGAVGMDRAVGIAELRGGTKVWAAKSRAPTR